MNKYFLLCSAVLFSANAFAGALEEAKNIAEKSNQATQATSATEARMVSGCGIDYECNAKGERIYNPYKNNPNVVDLGKGDSHTVEIIKKDTGYHLGPNKVPPKPGQEEPILEPKTLQDGENTKVILDAPKEKVKAKVEQAKEKVQINKEVVKEQQANGKGRPVVGHNLVIKSKPTKPRPSMKQAFSKDPFAADNALDKKGYKSAEITAEEKEIKTSGVSREELIKEVSDQKQAIREANESLETFGEVMGEVAEVAADVAVQQMIGQAINHTTYKPAKVTTTGASRPADVYRRGIYDSKTPSCSGPTCKQMMDIYKNGW